VTRTDATVAGIAGPEEIGWRWGYGFAEMCGRSLVTSVGGILELFTACCGSKHFARACRSVPGILCNRLAGGHHAPMFGP
jgi:hypothetical protein